MAFLEVGTFCTIEEYENGLPDRVDESQIRKDDLYMMAIRLDSDEKEAAKMPFMALDKIRNAGSTVVRFALLDADLEILCEAEGHVVNGLFDPMPKVFIWGSNSSRFSVRQAYLKDYFEDQFGGLLSESRELELAK